MVTQSEMNALGALAVNSLRVFPHYGRVVWGARTLIGADHLSSDWKYILEIHLCSPARLVHRGKHFSRDPVGRL